MADSFDPSRHATNRAKHGISLAFGDSIFLDADHIVEPSIRPVDGEERFKVIGLVDDRLFTGVFVWRGRRPRFISVRRSNDGEQRLYRAAL